MSQVTIEKLRFEGVTAIFEGQEAVFSNVDFDFPMNQMVWIRAEHGNGRSTLLQILAALQIPNKGSYWINDLNVTDMSFEEFLPYRMAIGYGFDQGGLIHNRTLFDNLILPLSYHKLIPHADAVDRVSGYLADFGLWKYKDVRPSFIPGGSKKLACLLRAILLEPQMVLLDDPTVGLSQETALKYFDRLQKMRDKGTLKHIFVSSYDDKFMGLHEHADVYIDAGVLHLMPQMGEKKVVNL